jgi:histone deacetylase 11
VFQAELKDFIDDEHVHIIDFFNERIFPNDKYAKRGIDVAVHCSMISGDAYLRKLGEVLTRCEFEPDFVFYNAGTDCMEGDPLGEFCILLSSHVQVE